MSLNVPPAVIDAAAHAEIDDTTCAAVVLATDPRAEYTEHAVPPPDEAARGQLLRALASDASAARWNDTSGCGWRSRTAT